MITIEMNTARLKLTVKGHAMPEETNEKQSDIICAAASALAQALMYTITKYNSENKEGAARDIVYKNDPGNLMIKVFPENWAERELKHRFRIYGDGMQLLAESHPQSVTMIRDGERIIAQEEEGKHE